MQSFYPDDDADFGEVGFATELVVAGDIGDPLADGISSRCAKHHLRTLCHEPKMEQQGIAGGIVCV